MPTALVTGAAGFISFNLSEALLERGYRVRGADNLTTGRRQNLQSFEERDEFEFHEADIRDESTMSDLVEDVDYVFHQAAVPSVPRSVDDPITTTDASCTGTATVLDAARHANIDTVVVALSSSVYGSSTGLPKVESMTLNPESHAHFRSTILRSWLYNSVIYTRLIRLHYATSMFSDQDKTLMESTQL